MASPSAAGASAARSASPAGAVAPLAARFEGGRPTCRLRLGRGRTARVTVRVDAAGTSVTRVVTVRRPR